METLTLMLDTAALVALIFFSLRNERLPPGAPEQGPFRVKPSAAPAAAPATAKVKATARTSRLKRRVARL